MPRESGSPQNSAITNGVKRMEVIPVTAWGQNAAPFFQRRTAASATAGDGIGATLYGAATVEAFLNDLENYLGVHDPTTLSPAMRAASCGLSELENANSSARTKLGFLSAVFRGSEIDSGKEPFQSVFLLIKIRNSIAHPRPEFVGDLQDNPRRTLRASRTLTQELISRKLINPKAAKTCPLWQRLLENNANYSEWAACTSMLAIDAALAWIECAQTANLFRSELFPPSTKNG